jgi:hypothetical protein
MYCGFLVVAVLLASATAASAGTWSIQTTREPEQSTNLWSVSCVTKVACTSVGDSEDLTGRPVPVAAKWDGKAWLVQEAPSVAEAKRNSLDGVSCVVLKLTECIAVGYSDNGIYLPLAERWNGEAWALQKAPGPAGSTYNFLRRVSCAAVKPIACMAVGSYQNSSGESLSLAESWNGEEWTIREVPSPEGGKLAGLLGVSCAAIKLTECTAVGDYTTKAGITVGLAERWDGKSWSIQATPNPEGAKATNLEDVSCPSAVFCSAVGVYDDASEVSWPVIESWNGENWSIEKLPLPAKAEDFRLESVSCISAVNCTAVGEYYTEGPSVLTPFVESWNGKAWSINNALAPPEGKGRMNAVSCVSALFCSTVGGFVGVQGVMKPFGESWSGTEWSSQSVTNSLETRSSTLLGVSCPTTVLCRAAGNEVDGSGIQVAMEQHWEPEAFTTWNFSAIDYPATGKASNLQAMSCAAPLNCIAAGDYINEAGTEAAFAEDGNQPQAPPVPSQAKASGLQGISCTVVKITECIAVGEYVNSSGVKASLADSWNEKNWSTLKVTEPTESKTSGLGGVSCAVVVKLGECIAVGSYTNKLGVTATLAEGWNGKAWTVQETPTLSSAKVSSLRGVSCNVVKLLKCVAVGSYITKAGTQVTLAESWNGKTWTAQEALNPEGARASSLTGVSCALEIACTAVGSYITKAGTQVTLAESWNGTTWTAQATPNPEGARASSLSGVSCASIAICVAAGEYVNKAGTQTTLAEGFG